GTFFPFSFALLNAVILSTTTLEGDSYRTLLPLFSLSLDLPSHHILYCRSFFPQTTTSPAVPYPQTTTNSAVPSTLPPSSSSPSRKRRAASKKSSSNDGCTTIIFLSLQTNASSHPRYEVVAMWYEPMSSSQRPFLLLLATHSR
ncbi:unnamed protein product, partial [Linum tenue]